MRLIHLCYSLYFICLFNTSVYSQIGNSETALIQRKIENFTEVRSSIPLFLHIDKTVYTENEPIWFSAYLLNNGYFDISKYKVLHLFLFRHDDRSVALSGKFKIKKGLSAGDIVLPDSIPAGKYELVAYTNILNGSGKPTAIFRTPITVKSTKLSNFSSSIMLLDSMPKGANIRAKLTIKNDDKDKSNPIACFTINNDTLRTIEVKKKEVIVDIPAKYLTADRPVLHTSIKHGNQIQHLNTTLPSSAEQRLHVDFFPESGDLVAGLPSLVAMEAKDEKGNPVSVKGFLFKGESIIDSFETNNNGYAKFNLTPERNHPYSVKIRSSAYLVKDTTYILPKLSGNHLTFHLPDAVADDTLQIHLFNSREDTSLFQIAIRNHNGFYTLFKAKATPRDTLKIPLDKLPRGIATLTILDESNRPLGERLFFAHFNKGIDAAIDLDTPAYGTRKEVTAGIQVRDFSKQPVKGLFSVAVVQSNRMEGTFKFIDDYVYLEKGFEVPTQIPHAGWPDYTNKDLLEDILLIKGWRRYTWTDIMQADSESGIPESEIPPVVGQVKKFKKSLKEAVELALLGGDHLNLIKTGTDGSFKLDNEHLFVSGSDNKLSLIVSNGKNNGFSVELEDPSDSINKRLAKDIKIDTPFGTNDISESRDDRLEGMENTFYLDEVTVKGNKGNASLYAYKGKPGPNACGDYVDDAGFLNYEYSSNRYQPVIGKLYQKRIDLSTDRATFRVEPVVYHGCLTEEHTGVSEVDGIYAEREFYGVDIPRSEPQYLSTLFWKPHVLTDDKGRVQIKFNTGDIKDEFSIVVQGVTDYGVFSKVQTFIVK